VRRVNAAVSLLANALPATVHVHAQVPPEHPSAGILGVERMGTGTVIDSSGLILTVSYIAMGASTITVTTLDEQEYDAELVKYDFVSGLAVLRVPGVRLPSLEMRHTRDLSRGEPAFAVASVGPGKVRAADGFVTDLGAFDATWEYVLERAVLTSAMNPGLGGGPLLDRFGQMIGVVSLNLGEIGKFTLAVPTDCFLDAAPQFLTLDGANTIGTRAWLGVFCHVIEDRVIVAGLMKDGPCAAAGLKPGDIVLSVDDHEIVDRPTLYRHVWQRRPGDAVALRVFRDRGEHALTVPLGDVAAYFA
jgi:S1-C subfamily serine protease